MVGSRLIGPPISLGYPHGMLPNEETMPNLT